MAHKHMKKKYSLQLVTEGIQCKTKFTNQISNIWGFFYDNTNLDLVKETEGCHILLVAFILMQSFYK